MKIAYTIAETDNFVKITLENGVVLSMSRKNFKEADGLLFKNLSGSDSLLPYEDWRLSAQVRAEDLAGRLSAEEIAGLMLWSPHQMVPFLPGMPFVGHYDGAAFDPRTMDPAALTDQQKGFLDHENLRNILLVKAQSAQVAARWNNRLQARAEQSRWGIPVCISSDPRHAAGSKDAEFAGTGQEVSRWPEGLGMAATFDPGLMKRFASIVAKEYRAMGISQALGPQIDLATDPRWMRLEDTMGAKTEMVTEFARAYCDGLQTTEGAVDGWGMESVSAMVKHWPGGGTGESGRDAHYAYGKYAVYPGGRFEEHRKPFTQGAFRLDGPTKKAASVMPYYTISWEQDTAYGENVGNSFSKFMIRDLLRDKEGYDGIVCTDWGVTHDAKPNIGGFGATPHGVEHLSEAEKHLKALESGVDMFGGNSDKAPVLEAYRIGCEKFGEAVMRRRMEQSAVRILRQMFRLGLFENPYLDPEASSRIVGAPEFVREGLEAQRRSVVLLKNRERLLPLKKGCKIYVPERHLDSHYSFFRTIVPEMDVSPLGNEECAPWFSLTEKPQDADCAVVFLESPLCDCYTDADLAAGGNGYLPITLQYEPYTAEFAREHSIARGDRRENDCDRTYRGKVNTPYNHRDLDNVRMAREKMGDKPVILVLRLHNPCVLGEVEPLADGIVAHFGVENRVLLEILAGEENPGGRLPVILPADMRTVEEHCEDVFEDLRAYRDTCGNVYDYGFGLNYGDKK